MNRRGILGALVGAPIFGPKAAKAVALELGNPNAFRQGGMVWRTSSGDAQMPKNPYPTPPVPEPHVDMSDPKSWVTFLRDRAMRAEVESLLYEQCHDVPRIDPDIDVHRSFSRMAKVTFQRQRIVARYMEARQQLGTSRRITGLVGSFFGMRVSGLNIFD